MRALTLSLLILSFLPAVALAQCMPPTLYVTDLDSEYECGSPLLEYLFHDLEFVLTCPYRPEGITRVEFAIGELPDEYAGGSYTLTWFADHVEGDPQTGLVLTWDEPFANQAPPEDAYSIFVIGKLSFALDRDPFYLPDNYPITSLVGEGLIVDEAGRSKWMHCGNTYILNCTEWPDACCGSNCNIDPPESWRQVRYEEPEDGSTVIGHFDLSFEVEFWSCMYGPVPFIGFVVAFGDTVLQFAGDGEGNYATGIDAGAAEPSEEFPVLIEVHAHNFPGGIFSRTLHYTADAPTGVDSSSFSVIKSLY